MPQATSRADLQTELNIFAERIAKPVHTARELETNLSGIYHSFRNIEFSRYDLGAHRSKAPVLMAALFDIQQAVRTNIRDWHAKGLMTFDAEDAARHVLRVTRYARDILGELWIGHERLTPDRKTLRAFTGSNHNTFVAEKFLNGSSIPFQAGDVILTRGRLHNSAAIARIGDVDSQFSHIAMVYIEPDGKHWTVESIIEEGGQITPLNELLSHDLARAIVFRHKDPLVAQRAAHIMHDRIRRSLKPGAKRILYDFTMQLDNEQNLFCSKLIRRAYKEATDGKLVLPTFPTELSMKNRDFIERIGVMTTETFAPADIELEPDFDVVAEWQDYRATAEVRLQDFAMDKMFEWMENDNFRFRETLLIKLISISGRGATYLSDTAQDLVFNVIPKIPPNMSRRAVAAIAMLNDTASELYEILSAQDEKVLRNTGLPMHPRQILEKLDEIHAMSPNEFGYLKRVPLR